MPRHLYTDLTIQMMVSFLLQLVVTKGGNAQATMRGLDYTDDGEFSVTISGDQGWQCSGYYERTRLYRSW